MDAPEQEIAEDYRTAFDLAGVGKAQVDPGTRRFTGVNAKYCEMTGNSAEELLGMTFKDPIPMHRTRLSRILRSLCRGRYPIIPLNGHASARMEKPCGPSSVQKCYEIRPANPRRCWQ
jgi:PAS domain-containing protein